MRLTLKRDLTLTKVVILSIAKAIERTAGHKKFVLDKFLKKCYNYYTIKKEKKFQERGIIMVVKILKIVCYILFAWIVVSYFDVILHNIGSCHYQSWNAFELIVKNLLTN